MNSCLVLADTSLAFAVYCMYLWCKYKLSSPLGQIQSLLYLLHFVFAIAGCHEGHASIYHCKKMKGYCNPSLVTRVAAQWPPLWQAKNVHTSAAYTLIQTVS